MATGRKTVVVGQVIDPTVWGNPLWDQSVQTFASAADRLAQFPAPRQGAMVWLEDLKRFEGYNGAAWVPVSGIWQDYVPAWLAGGVGVNVGAAPGAVTGRYERIGNTVHAKILCGVGAGWAAPGAVGTQWTWGLPPGLPADGVWTAYGWLNGPVIQIAAARVNGAVLEFGVTGPGNTLVTGYALAAGATIQLEAIYRTTAA